ncbi:MAG: hypothetical protein IPM64_00775 [Phycisphaerales bacterium]|nr:hypothetical protein [Phycisphaerales bacterium]
MSADPAMPRLGRVLLSAWDKAGLAEFARSLHVEFGAELLSTGGTAAALSAAGLPVTLIETVTGQPEMLDGRVKTLHPAVHAGILANRTNPDHLRQIATAGITAIDAVVVDLYPFESVTADPACDPARAIEMIDIGGVALLRAAAKNHEHVLVLSASADRAELLSLLRDATRVAAAGGWSAVRRQWAARTLERVSRYDAAIAAYLRQPSASGARACSAAERGGAAARVAEGSAARVSEGVAAPVADHALESWPLRYGENPHQAARVELHGCGSAERGAGAASGGAGDASRGAGAASCGAGGPSLPAAVALAARRGYQPADAVSYNNLLDADAALELCADLARGFPGAAACCFVKHSNACGVGVAGAGAAAVDAAARAEAPSIVASSEADAREAAYRLAYLGDPNAAMGGVLAVSHEVDAAYAKLVMETFPRFGRPLRESGAAHAPGAFFLEVWVAPSFADDAVAVIRGNAAALGGPVGASSASPGGGWGERVRLLPVGPMAAGGDALLAGSGVNAGSGFRRRDIAGGALWQSVDALGGDSGAWRVVTRRAPTPGEMIDLRAAWLICKHTRSNAISLVRGGALLGNGAGQMSRVMSCRVAVWLARENGHAAALPGAVAASDAFFPFADGPRLLLEAGVRAIIQPGGSKRDADTIALCDEAGVAMIFTSERHFRH